MSSIANKYITNKQAVPVIKNDLFKKHPKKRFALGVFNADSVLGYKTNDLMRAYLQLRANVYIDQTKMIKSHLKRVDGTELDQDDKRSTHFVMFENRGDGKIAVFASMRFIIKTTADSTLLPIEDFFGSEIKKVSPIKSLEVSRFIVRHDEPKYQKFAKFRIMITGLAYTVINNLGPVFAVVEPDFEDNLAKSGVPVRRIASPKWVDEYNDYNLGLELDKSEFKRRIGSLILKKVGIAGKKFNKLQMAIGWIVLKNITISIGKFRYW